MSRRSAISVAIVVALVVSLQAGGCASTPKTAPPDVGQPVAPVAVADPPVVTPAPAVPEVAQPVAVDIRGGGNAGLDTVVEEVAVTPVDGGAQIRVRFRDGVPVWAAHVGAHGQQLFLDLGAPLTARLTPTGSVAGVTVWTSGGPFSSLVAVATIPMQMQYEAVAGGQDLTVTVRRGGQAPLGGKPPEFPGMERTGQAVDAFLKARVGSNAPGAGALAPEAASFVSDLARLQFEHLYGTQPVTVTQYRKWAESGQWPGDVHFYMMRLEGDGWFSDEMLYVTAESGAPRIAMVLGHPPVQLPADADGRAALRVADQYLSGEAHRDRDAMWAAMSLASQRKYGAVTELHPGLSNPHALRYEIHGIRAAEPACWQLDVLRSEEYTGEGELGWGVGPLYVVKEEGRFGVLAEGSCGPQ